MINFIKDHSFEDKKVVARFDFNVPIKNGQILDTTRIDRSMTTINYLLKSGAKKIVLMSHLGRPKGKVDKSYSLEPVANYLAKKLNEEVVLTETATDRGIKTLLNLPNNRLILLQNLRFHLEETSNDLNFAKKLSSYGDVYINDAFGTSHREHASTYGVTKFFQQKNTFAGFLIEKELQALERVLESPKKPFLGIVGGAKVSDKIKIIERLLGSVDSLIIGGAMAYPFLKAKDINIGKSLCSDADVVLAKKILSHKSGQKIILPKDHLLGTSINDNAQESTNSSIEDNMIGLDIGPQTLENLSSYIKSAKTIIWNGPMGYFEKKQFSKGTMGVAQLISNNQDCFSLVGGGDSVSAVNKTGLADKISHISTGGGASLEYIEQGSLPGIKALKYGVS